MAIGNLNIAGGGVEAYPIGSIYMSFNSTEPSILFGGTQERIKDRFILAAGDGYEAGATGGEESVKLTSKNIPVLSDRSGGIAPVNTKGNAIHVSQWGWIYTATQISNSDGYDSYTGQWISVGTDDANMQNVNNMPPYLVAYMWYRTA